MDCAQDSTPGRQRGNRDTEETTMTVHDQIAREYDDIADYIATATTIEELDILHEGTFTVPTPVGIELRRRIDVRGYALGARG
jgi:hypothetical protein